MFLPWNSPPSLGYPYYKNGDETFGWWGFRTGDTTRNKQQTTSLADVTPVWYHFDRNVRTIEWFSYLITKTALDRNRRVVFTNTCVFFLLQVLYQHTANQTNRALLVWKTVGSNAAHNITKAVMLFTHSHYLMHFNLNINSYNKNKIK